MREGTWPRRGRRVTSAAIVGLFATSALASWTPSDPASAGWGTEVRIHPGRVTRSLEDVIERAVRFAGPPRIVRRIGTDDDVVFVTIDDGWTRSAGALRLIRRIRMPVSVFPLTAAAQGRRISFFRDLKRAGARIGNHTRTHPWLPGLPFARAQREICGASRELARRLGNRPVVMRPPYGGWSERLMPAAEACGIHTIVLWSAEVIHGQLITRNGGGLRGGDIVLLHFRRDLRRDLIVLRAAARERGLRFAPLANYL